MKALSNVLMRYLISFFSSVLYLPNLAIILCVIHIPVQSRCISSAQCTCAVDSADLDEDDEGIMCNFLGAFLLEYKQAIIYSIFNQPGVITYNYVLI